MVENHIAFIMLIFNNKIVQMIFSGSKVNFCLDNWYFFGLNSRKGNSVSRHVKTGKEKQRRPGFEKGADGDRRSRHGSRRRAVSFQAFLYFQAPDSAYRERLFGRRLASFVSAELQGRQTWRL
ncbi:hypothetical protein [Rhizobium mesosinicum]|uniref:Uncharacterized protein n=1 Tax=Rhizobium mesosinicum TaxID=335017 RepID=A0ABS7H0S3_9HYPH|nr:hypothetical protein [Rhizobium mesosinicum]MBW9055467.1 hypothetical protein [Rhizobium mesosinicum]